MTADSTDSGRGSAGAGSTTDDATTAAARLALTVTLDAAAGVWGDTDAVDGAAVFRVDSAKAGLALALGVAAAIGLIFFTGPVENECPEPDGFFSELLVDPPALTPSAPVSWPDADVDGMVPVDPFTASDGVVSIDPITESDGVVPDGVVSIDPAIESDGVVPVDPDTEPDGVVPVDPDTEPDGVVPVDPATEPDGVEVVLEVVEASEEVDASEAGVAHATPTEQEKEIADPMPKATANAPTRPM